MSLCLNFSPVKGDHNSTHLLRLLGEFGGKVQLLEPNKTSINVSYCYHWHDFAISSPNTTNIFQLCIQYPREQVSPHQETSLSKNLLPSHCLFPAGEIMT